MKKVALKPSTPAGGSVAALNAASAAALAEMAAHLTLGKIESEESKNVLENIVRLCSGYRERFIADMDRDTAAFGEVLASFRLPAGTDEERKIKNAALQNSYKTAVNVPLDITKSIWAMMEIVKMLLIEVNPKYATDAAQAYMLAESALRSLLYHIRANLIYIEDSDFVERVSNLTNEFKSSLEHRHH